MCNGHAYICPPTANSQVLQCECQHRTQVQTLGQIAFSREAQKCRYVDLPFYIIHQGINCEECQDGFTQKKWRRYTADDQFECEPCNCHGHTKKCSYNETVS